MGHQLLPLHHQHLRNCLAPSLMQTLIINRQTATSPRPAGRDHVSEFLFLVSTADVIPTSSLMTPWSALR